ncbi:MAG: sodium-dependent transporter [Lachnospiraceae bacterium]|nr:sodium-dependent transporter [Lachnospiraceae bacterium]
MEREQLGSRLGFILLSAGCAIGCGNVWKFPWMTGRNGGGAFVLVYVICLVVLGLPAMTVEFSIGRASQASPVKMYQKLEKPGQKWHWHGILAMIGNFCLMAFYTVVTGWILYYFISFLTGRSENLGFTEMITNPGLNVGYLAVVVVIAFLILSFNIQSGLERVTKYMMVALLCLMVVLAVRSCMMENGAEGLKFYLLPDFSKINFKVIVAAMNQAFFTLSIGIGSMAIFGSYIGKERSLMGESVNVIVLDTFVAIMSGMIIFPACTSLGLDVSDGPALLFNTMAAVFNSMEGGRIWGTIFFLFMTFAAFSTVIAVCENILACVRELTGWSRKKGAVVTGTIVFLSALTTALGYSVLHFHPFAEDSAWLEFWDFIVSTNLLPLGALIMTLFCVSDRFGWGWDNFVKEANAGKGLKVRNWMKPVFKYAVPVIVIGLYIIGLVNFDWS